MATAVINSVPEKIGIAPKAPELATWSSLIAVCGLHDRPKRKSKKGICSKNLTASKINENTMPIVVSIAIIEQKIRSFIFIPSTDCLALNLNEIFLSVKILPNKPKNKITK